MKYRALGFVNEGNAVRSYVANAPETLDLHQAMDDAERLKATTNRARFFAVVVSESTAPQYFNEP